MTINKIKYYSKPSNLLDGILNGVFKIKMFLCPKKKKELEDFIEWMEEEFAKEAKRRSNGNIK